MIKKLEKAIRHFECMRDNNIAVLNSGFGTKKGEHNSLYKNRKMYAELAIEALEKQIPMKVKYRQRVLYEYCPACNFGHLSSDNFYCSYCGQRVEIEME